MATILIIEDDTVMLRVYNRIFTFEGFEVITALDGEKGLAMLAEQLPDVILLDVMMPKMSGYEVLDRLKADERLKDIPVFILTNLMSKQDLDTAYAKGAVKCIVKSQYDPKQVVMEVKVTLEQKGIVVQPQQSETNNQPTQ